MDHKNEWPPDAVVTQYPDRLTVEVDAGDIQAVHEWALAAYRLLHKARFTEARDAIEELIGDTFLERLMWKPAESVAGVAGVDLNEGEHSARLWQSLVDGNDWARDAQTENRRALTAPTP